MVDARDLKSHATTDNANIFGKTLDSAPVETAANPARLENISSAVFERENGQFQVDHNDDAPCFPTRQFALKVACAASPCPAPVVKFSDFNAIREVRYDASA